MNCMLVFHYVANALKDLPIFDTNIEDDSDVSDDENGLDTNGSGSGAIYNDFDNDPQSTIFLENEDEFCYSQTSNLRNKRTNTSQASVQEAVDHAVMAEDKAVGVNHNHLT